MIRRDMRIFTNCIFQPYRNIMRKPRNQAMEGVAGCNHVSVNLFWIVYQYSSNFRYKAFLDPLICAGSLPRLANVLRWPVLGFTSYFALRFAN
jgi:hypothetical protein